MGRARTPLTRTPLTRTPLPRSRVPLHRQLRTNAEAARRWLLVAALAAVTAWLVAASVSQGIEEKQRWGTTRTVLVTIAPIEARGHLEGDVGTEQWPEALVPDGAVTVLPPGARALAPLARGVPLTDEAIRPDPLAADPEDRTRVAVPLGPAALALHEGDRVDLWSTRDPSLAGSTGRGTVRTRRVAESAVVADASERSVTVAVRASESDEVVEALALSTVTVAAVD